MSSSDANDNSNKQSTAELQKFDTSLRSKTARTTSEMSQCHNSSKNFQEINNNELQLESKWAEDLLVYTEETQLRLDQCEKKLEKLRNSVETFHATQERRVMALLKLFRNLQDLVISQLQQSGNSSEAEYSLDQEHGQSGFIEVNPDAEDEIDCACSSSKAIVRQNSLTKNAVIALPSYELDSFYKESKCNETLGLLATSSDVEEDMEPGFTSARSDDDSAENEIHDFSLSSESSFSDVNFQEKLLINAISAIDDSTTVNDCTNLISQQDNVKCEIASPKGSLSLDKRLSAQEIVVEKNCSRKREKLPKDPLTKNIPSFDYCPSTTMAVCSSSDELYASNAFHLSSNQVVSSNIDRYHQTDDLVSSKSVNIFSKLKSRLTEKKRKGSYKLESDKSQHFVGSEEKFERRADPSMGFRDFSINDKYGKKSGNKFYRSQNYKFPQTNSNTHVLRLNSTGDDNDSRRGTDASDISLRDQLSLTSDFSCRNLSTGFNRRPRDWSFSGLRTRSSSMPLAAPPVERRSANGEKPLESNLRTPSSSFSFIDKSLADVKFGMVSNDLYQSINKAIEEENPYDLCDEPQTYSFGNSLTENNTKTAQIR